MTRWRVQIVEKIVYTRYVETATEDGTMGAIEQAMDDYANDEHDLGEYESAEADLVENLETGETHYVA